jgi:hypothetical protein
MRSLKYVLLILLILLGIAIPLAMRFRQGNTSSIEGFVLDEKGLPIARATVQASNIMHGGLTKASSQPNGFYRIVDLVGGRYSLWVEAKGHTSEWIPMVIVEEGQTTRKDIQLKREIPTEETQSTVAH